MGLFLALPGQAPQWGRLIARILGSQGDYSTGHRTASFTTAATPTERLPTLCRLSTPVSSESVMHKGPGWPPQPSGCG